MSGFAGICGAVNPDGLEEMVHGMLDGIRHRGSLRKAFVHFTGVALGVGHCREPEGERFAEDEDAVVVMDGDVLSGQDDWPNSENMNDARRILGLYRRFGLDFPERINGSYAIAIYDKKSGRIALVRDRLGHKPFFYSFENNRLVFGSEIKALLSTGLLEKSIDEKSLIRFFAFGYIPNPDTLLQCVKQIPAGCSAVFSGNELNITRYWRFEYNKDTSQKDEQEWFSRFLDIFETAVSRCLAKYPKADAFLSGGLDTSAVVAMMHRIRRDPFKVFTAGFEEKAYNETGDAKIMAEHLGLEHFTTIVKPPEDFLGFLEKLVWHHDAPFFDTSAVPSFFAAELARRHCEVVLTGDFPDQLIGGAGQQEKTLRLQATEHPLKRHLRRPVINRLFYSFPISAPTTSFFDRVKRNLFHASFPVEMTVPILNQPVPTLLRRHLLSPRLAAVEHRNDPMDVPKKAFTDAGPVGLLDKLLFFNIRHYAQDDLMVKVDRMTAANGLLAITPFHDMDLVEFIATVPESLKIKQISPERFVRKYIMKEAVRPMLAEHTLNKPKQGFAMPMADWLKHHLEHHARETILSDRALSRGYFNRANLKTMLDAFFAGRTDYATGSESTVIALLTLEIWHRLFLDN